MPRPSILDEMRRRGGCGDSSMSGGTGTISGGGIEMGVAFVMLIVLIAACFWFYKCCWKQDDPAPAAAAPAAAKFWSHR